MITRLQFPRLWPLLAILGVLSLSGCVYTSVTTKDGVKLTRMSLFGNQQIGEVDLQKGTMKGYVSEQSTVAGSIAEGVARGLSK